jgi:hypothetical protein
MTRAALFAAGLMLPALAAAQTAISREAVMAHAKAYAWHPWRCTAANQTASCSPSYRSIYPVGDFMGLPYDWGGYMSLFEFDQQIGVQFYGAGSYPADGILACTAGLDCSGFVSKCWDVGHYTTSNIATLATTVSPATAMLPGDAVNNAGHHVVLFAYFSTTGEPVFYESAWENVHLNAFEGWSGISGYVPLRRNNITGASAGDPVGTVTNPIVVPSLATPYTDSRNTADSPSDVFDGCGAAPGVPETGPEYVYRVTVTQPGRLTVSVSDDPGVDVDVHLYTALNTNDCIARDDVSFTQAVDCGTYYVVADTWRNAAGTDLVGPYTLNLSFAPSGGSCGAGPATYHVGGQLNTPCNYPGNESLPFCNPTFGSETCIYSTSAGSSFCSKSCTSMADCAAFPGGCCAGIGTGEYYCQPSAWCAGPDAGTPDAGPPPTPPASTPELPTRDRPPTPPASTPEPRRGTAPRRRQPRRRNPRRGIAPRRRQPRRRNPRRGIAGTGCGQPEPGCGCSLRRLAGPPGRRAGCVQARRRLGGRAGGGMRLLLAGGGVLGVACACGVAPTALIACPKLLRRSS